LEPRFLVPPDVRAFWDETVAAKKADAARRREAEQAWRRGSPERSRLLDAHLSRALPPDLGRQLADGMDQADSTRKLSSAVIQKVAALVPAIVGGSADLAESNLTDVKNGGSVGPGSYAGRNVHYGIR